MIVFRLFLALLLAAPAYAQSDIAVPDAPKPIKRTTPRMPVWAMQYNQPGEAIVMLTIDDGGRPHDIAVMHEWPRDRTFGKAAVTAVKSWLFEPGNPGRYKVTMRFYLKDIRRLEPAEGKKFEDMAPVAPAPLKREPPVYPMLAREKPLEGTVQILAAIEDGRFVRGGIVEAGEVSDVFGEAAFYAVLEWRFAETLNGRYLVEIPFTLDGLRRGQFSNRLKIGH